MTRLVGICLLLAACIGCQGSPVGAKPQAVAAEQSFVPAFAPPLGKPLLYRLTKERITPDSREHAVFDQQIEFERAQAGGFVLQIKWLRVALNGRSYDLVNDPQSFPAEARPMFMPMAMELDRDGRPLRMRDWPRLRRALMDLAPVMARAKETDPTKRAAAETFFRNFMQRYTTLSAEEAVDHMVQGWPPVLAELGAEVVLGKDDRTTMQAVTPFSAEPIDYDTTVSWTAGDGRALHLTRRSTPSTESLRSVGSGLARAARQSGLPGTPAGLNDLERVTSEMKLTMQTDIDFDRASGLVRKAVLEKLITVKGQTGTDRITIQAR